jgi:hypothetical protein
MSHDIRQWATVEVDIPTMSFEPKPPPPHEYRPDTVCDGWSNASFQVRLASVRGYTHRYSGTSRQDAVEVRAHPGTGGVVFAVADGVSAAPRSDLGAADACELATVTVLRALDRDPFHLDWTGIIHHAAARMCQRRGDKPAAVANVYGTTLVVGMVLPRAGGAVGSVAQIGDSAAWLLRDRRFIPLLDHKMSGSSTVVSSVVAAFPQLPDQINPVHFELAPGAVLLAGTDGFGDPLGDGTGLVGQLFLDLLREVPPPLGLAHTLDFSRETFDDDRTLVAIWPAGGPEGRP